MITAMRPMPPASRPLLSWSSPSDGETSSVWLGLNETGSAPNFRLLERFSASCWLNWPLIWVSPLMTDWVTGALMTTPSRVMPIWSVGDGGLPVSVSCVIFVQRSWPEDFQEMLTTKLPIWSLPGLADLMSLPNTSAFSRWYLTEPSLEQATIWAFGCGGSVPPDRTRGSAQSRAAKFAGV